MTGDKHKVSIITIGDLKNIAPEQTGRVPDTQQLLGEAVPWLDGWVRAAGRWERSLLTQLGLPHCGALQVLERPTVAVGLFSALKCCSSFPSLGSRKWKMIMTAWCAHYLHGYKPKEYLWSWNKRCGVLEAKKRSQDEHLEPTQFVSDFE